MNTGNIDRLIKEYYSPEDIGFLQDLSDEMFLKGVDLDAELDSQEVGSNKYFDALLNLKGTDIRETLLVYLGKAQDENLAIEERRKYMQAISGYQKMIKNKGY